MLFIILLRPFWNYSGLPVHGRGLFAKWSHDMDHSAWSINPSLFSINDAAAARLYMYSDAPASCHVVDQT